MPVSNAESIDRILPTKSWMQQHEAFHRLFQVYMKNFNDNFQPK